MRLIITLVVSLVVQCMATSPSSSRPRFYTADWMEEALASVLLADGGRKHTQEQEMQALSFTMYFYGFLDGINKSAFINREANAAQYPDTKFLELGDAAVSILAFMKEHKASIIKETKANDILIAWYLTNHPKSTDEQRSFGKFYLGVVANRAKKG